MNCPAQYTTTLADVATGRISNTAIVFANQTTGPPVTATAPAEVFFSGGGGLITVRQMPATTARKRNPCDRSDTRSASPSTAAATTG